MFKKHADEKRALPFVITDMTIYDIKGNTHMQEATKNLKLMTVLSLSIYHQVKNSFLTTEADGDLFRSNKNNRKNKKQNRKQTENDPKEPHTA